MYWIRKKIEAFLSKYFTTRGHGAVRMNNAIGQFQTIVDELNKAVGELADQRGMYDAEMNKLQDRIDKIKDMKTRAGENIGRAIAIRNRVAGLIE